ncbi:hypothetical protein PQE20_17790 [Vibrio harveyi]|uniref:hypothetical protein n=1 Tax=Vibrio harveyi group TaxID=717610 RepID=UPI000BE2879F|nr:MULTISPECIES: hypothetical protein [Vibrio harveyi group]ATI44266.1 hypothetical protein CO725_01010 [Vibrio parahaemolyticus]WCP83271.1 hypothetical protein PQE20_17790 [Vibrio harveyi]
MKTKLTLILAGLFSLNAMADDCAVVHEKQSEYGTSFVNGLTLESIDDRSVVYNELVFSDYYNESMKMVGNDQYQMYEVKEEGSVVKFRNKENQYANRENMGERYRGGVIEVTIEKLPNNEYNVSWFKGRTGIGANARNVKYTFDKSLGNRIINDQDLSMPIKYKATDKSIERLKSLECSK